MKKTTSALTPTFVEKAKKTVERLVKKDSEPNKAGVTPTLLALSISNVGNPSVKKAIIISKKKTEILNISQEIISSCGRRSWRGENYINSWSIATYLKNHAIVQYDGFTSFRCYDSCYFKKHTDNIFEFSHICIDIKAKTTAEDWKFSKRIFVFWKERLVIKVDGMYSCVYSDMNRNGYPPEGLKALHRLFVESRYRLGYREKDLVPIFGETATQKVEEAFKNVSKKVDRMADKAKEFVIPELIQDPNYNPEENNYYAQYDRLDKNTEIIQLYRFDRGSTEPRYRIFIIKGKEVKVMKFNSADDSWSTTTRALDTVICCWFGYRKIFGIDELTSTGSFKYLFQNGKYIFDDLIGSHANRYGGQSREWEINGLILKHGLLFLKFPLLEKLTKIKACYIVSMLSNHNFKACYNDIFGTPANEDYSSLKGTGLTKEQIGFINDEIDQNYCYGNSMNIAKTIYSDINHLHIEQFSKLFRMCYSFVSNRYKFVHGYYGYRSRTFKWWENELFVPIAKHMFDLIKNKPSYDIPAFVSIMGDIYKLQMANPDAGVGILDITDCDQINRVHNILVDFDREHANERDERAAMVHQSALEKLLPKRIEKYEQIDKKFRVIVPKKCSDLVREGFALNHCVGRAYNTYNAYGESDILFLRKNDKPEKSFYTIEIKNDQLAQVHGFGNQWIGNDPDAAKYMYRYLNQHKIRFNDSMLRDTAIGYGKSSVLISMQTLMDADDGEEE